MTDRHQGAHWGVAVRGPKRRLDEEDMRLIAKAMGVLGEFESVQDYASRQGDTIPFVQFTILNQTGSTAVIQVPINPPFLVRP